MKSKEPTFWYERRARRLGYDTVIGVDEVGRGALAGPVVAAAVCLGSGPFSVLDSRRGRWGPAAREKKALSPRLFWESLGIDDSKKLTPREREKLAKMIKEKARWGIGEVSVATINRMGIVKATEKAMRLAVAKVREGKTFVLVDAFHVKYIPGVGLKNQKAVIKGDQKVLSVAAASIIAKVYRDALMAKLAKKYRHFGWEKSKGYGTKKHLTAVRKFGLTRIHRLQFCQDLV